MRESDGVGAPSAFTTFHPPSSYHMAAPSSVATPFLSFSFHPCRSAFIYTTSIRATYTRIYVHTRQVITFALVASRILHSILPILSCPFNYPESRMVQHRLSLMRERKREREAREYRSFVVVVVVR